MPKKFIIKDENGVEHEVYAVQEVDGEISGLNTQLNNRKEEVARIIGERDAARTEATGLKEEVKKVETLTAENTELNNKLSTKDKKLALVTMFAGKIPAASLEQLIETPLFINADISTPETITAFETSVKEKFAVFFNEKQQEIPPTFKIDPKGGNGGNADPNTVITKMADLKGKSEAEINTALNEMTQAKKG